MVHTFTALGQYLVADVNSGAVHVLDPMSYDLLSRVEGEEKLGEHCPQDILEALSQYDPVELEETWQELRALQDQGLLFSSDDYLDPEAAMELPRQAVVKALCLHVSHDCNLRCRYCFAGTGDFGTGHRMTMDRRDRQEGHRLGGGEVGQAPEHRDRLLRRRAPHGHGHGEGGGGLRPLPGERARQGVPLYHHHQWHAAQ